MEDILTHSSNENPTNTGNNPILGLLILMLGLLIPYLYLMYNVPALTVLLFYFGVLLFLYFPGLFLLEVLHWEDNSVSKFILSVLAGMAITPILYYIALIIGLSWLYLVVIAIMIIYIAYIKRPWQTDISANLKLPNSWWKIITVFIIALTLLHFSHLTDLKITTSGSYQLRVIKLTETIYHLGITNAARNAVPPVYPYASGYDFSEYHIDMHLLCVVFADYLGLDTTLLIFFFLPLLLMFLIIAVPAVFFYSMHPNTSISLFFGLLMLGTDFSFIPALIKGGTFHYPWTLIFCTTIWSQLTLNGIMPAIPLLFGSLLAYQRFFSTRTIQYLFVFSLFTYSAYRMKNSMGLQIIAIAFMALSFVEWRHRIGVWHRALVVLIPTSLIIALDSYLKTRNSTSAMVIKWDFFNGIIKTAGYMEWQSWITAVHEPLKHPLMLIFAFLVFFLGCMGARIVFVKYFYDLFKDDNKDNVVTPFLMFFVLGGMVLAEMIFIGGIDSQINNSVWFRVQAIIAATYFLVALIASIKIKRHQLLAMNMVLILMFPTMLNFIFWRYDNAYVDISKYKLLAVDYMKNNFPPKCCVFEFPYWQGPSLTANFAGRSTVLSYYMTFVESKLSPAEFNTRANDQKQFFTDDTELKRKEILARYKAQYLIIPTELNSSFENYNWLSRLYINSEVTIYGVNLNKG